MDIALLEDDPALVEIFTFNFNVAGYRFNVVASFADLQTLMQTEAPRLLILDPRLLSPDDRKEFQTGRPCANIPVVLLSTDTQERNRMFAADVGAISLMAKPFHLQALLKAVENALTQAEEVGQ